MATLPQDDLTTTHTDSDTDSPLLARAEIDAVIDKVKAILAAIDPGNSGAITVWTDGNDGSLAKTTAVNTFTDIQTVTRDNALMLALNNANDADDPITAVAFLQLQHAGSRVWELYVKESGDQQLAIRNSGGTAKVTIEQDASTLAMSSGAITYGGTSLIPTNGALLGPVSTTSGTTADISGIPATATQVDVLVAGVSMSNTNALELQLGTASGFVTSGYISAYRTSSGSNTGPTDAFLIARDSAGNYAHWLNVHLTKLNDNRWYFETARTMVVVGGTTTASVVTMFSGYVDLGAALTQVRLRPSGANTFDSGEYMVRYR